MFPRIVLNELIKELLIVWSYRLQWVGEIVSLIIFFMFLFNLTNETEYAAISYCLWFYSILIIGDISGKISVDMKAGTFEQVYLSIVPFKKLLIAKILSSIIRSTVLVAILFYILILHILKHLDPFSYLLYLLYDRGLDPLLSN